MLDGVGGEEGKEEFSMGGWEERNISPVVLRLVSRCTRVSRSREILVDLGVAPDRGAYS